MNSHRGLITTAAAILVGLSAVPSAGASSLLSGYGGPGQGSQAILGSALVNTPGGGSGGSSSGGGAGGGTGGGGSIAAPGSASGTSGGGTPHTSAAAPSGSRAAGAPTSGRSSVGGGAAHRLPAVSFAHEPAADTAPLGISGADLVYILLVLGGLMLTAVMTRRVAGGPRQGGRAG